MYWDQAVLNMIHTLTSHSEAAHKCLVCYKGRFMKVGLNLWFANSHVPFWTPPLPFKLIAFYQPATVLGKLVREGAMLNLKKVVEKHL